MFFELDNPKWDYIREQLVDIAAISKRISLWPRPNLMSVPGIQSTLRLRKSNACFYDAMVNLSHARYALAAAMASSDYYIGKSALPSGQLDYDKAIGYSLRRYHSNYAALLICSGVFHTLNGLVELFNVTQVSIPKKKRNELERAILRLEQARPESAAAISYVQTLANDQYWGKCVSFRNDWVHNKPPMVETELYDPPRHGYSFHTPFTDLGFLYTYNSKEHEFTWNDVVEMLKGGIVAFHKLLWASADEWEAYKSAQQGGL